MKKKEKVISIAKNFATDRTTRVAGEKLRHLILEARAQERITRIESSISFFDEALAKLALEGWSHEDISEWVVFDQVHKKDRELIEKLCVNRGL